MTIAPTLEAERAAPCPFCGQPERAQHLPTCWFLLRDLGASRTRLAQAWNRRTAAPVAEGVALPPLPEPTWQRGGSYGVFVKDGYTAEQVRQAQLEAVEADRARQVLAWAVLAANGNVIIWSRRRDEVERVAIKYSKPVTPVIAYIDGRTAGTAPEAVNEAGETSIVQDVADVFRGCGFEVRDELDAGHPFSVCGSLDSAAVLLETVMGKCPPSDPTGEMVRAGSWGTEAGAGLSDEQVIEIYRAMIAAAPSPLPPQEEANG